MIGVVYPLVQAFNEDEAGTICANHTLGDCIDPRFIEHGVTKYPMSLLPCSATIMKNITTASLIVLWPILHYRLDVAEFARRTWSTNILRNIENLLRGDGVLWIDDYHLIPLAKMLRERGHTNQIDFFLHIPCPQILTALEQKSVRSPARKLEAEWAKIACSCAQALAWCCFYITAPGIGRRSYKCGLGTTSNFCRRTQIPPNR